MSAAERQTPRHPILRYHLLYPLYVLIVVKDIIVGKAQLRKQLRGDVMVLKHRTALVSLLLYARATGSDDGTLDGGTADVVETAAWGAMDVDRAEADALESVLGIQRRTFRDYFDVGTDGDGAPLSTAGSGADLLGTVERAREATGAEPYESRDSVLPWAKKTMDLLNEAESRSLFRTEDAFRAYFEARRLLLYGLRELDPTAVQIRGRSVLARARAFPDPDRRATIEDLLTDDGVLKERLRLQEVLEANEILHTHYLEVYRRMESIRINILNFMLNTAVAIVFIVFLFRGVALEPSVENRTFLILVMIFGVMGASISGLLTAGQGTGPIRHLEQVLGEWLALARTIIGAASALLVYILLVAGFVTEGAPSSSLILSVSFAAGFSERLLLNAIGTIESLGPGGK